MLCFRSRRDLGWCFVVALLFLPGVGFAFLRDGGRAAATPTDGTAVGKLSADPVRFKVVVSEFIPLASSDSFIDGSGVVYSHTMLSVIEPAMHFGRELTIEHVGSPDEGSEWSAVGTELIIDLPAFVLESPGLIIPVGNARLFEQ
jgi:hypothetical protein